MGKTIRLTMAQAVAHFLKKQMTVVDGKRVPNVARNARQRESGTHVNRHAALQVRQGEGFLAIAAVRGADEVEQGIVLRDGYQSPVAECPSLRGEISPKHPYLADKWT